MRVTVELSATMQQAAQQLDGLVDPRESRLDLMLAHRSKLAQASLSVSARLPAPLPVPWCPHPLGAEQPTLCSLQLPYFKQRARAPAASGDGQAEAARLRKQLAELSKDFQGLLKAHEKADGTLQDVQGKIRVLRQEVAQKDKALDLCRRTIDRLTAEKAQMEVRCSAWQLGDAGVAQCRFCITNKGSGRGLPHKHTQQCVPWRRVVPRQTRRTSAGWSRGCCLSRMQWSCSSSAASSRRRWG